MNVDFPLISARKPPTSPLQEKNVDSPPATSSSPPNRHEVDFKANLRKVKKTPGSGSGGHNNPELKRETSDLTHNAVDFKATLRKRSESNGSFPEAVAKAERDNSSNIVDFKAKLKKAAPQTTKEAPTEEAPSAQVDFKARLRRVSGNKPVVTLSKNNGSSNGNASDPATPSASGVSGSAAANDGEEAAGGDGDDGGKRKSTGSISSLRKMWESTDSPCKSNNRSRTHSAIIPIVFSSALGGRKGKHPDGDAPELASPTSRAALSSPTSESEARPPSVVKFEKRVWPPVPSTETEKPMVPVKPTMKTPAPPTTKPPPPKVCREKRHGNRNILFCTYRWSLVRRNPL